MIYTATECHERLLAPERGHLRPVLAYNPHLQLVVTASLEKAGRARRHSHPIIKWFM